MRYVTVDPASELLQTVEAGLMKRMSAERTEPELDLIEPRRVSGRKI